MASNSKKRVTVTYQVDYILNQRFDKKLDQILYLVKWKGYGNQYNTWEPFQHLKQVPQKISQWQQSKIYKQMNSKDEIKEQRFYAKRSKMPQKTRQIKKLTELSKNQQKKIDLTRDEKQKIEFKNRTSTDTYVSRTSSLEIEQKSNKNTSIIEKISQDKHQNKEDLQLVHHKDLIQKLGLQKVNSQTVMIIVEESLSQPEEKSTKEANIKQNVQKKIPQNKRMAVNSKFKEQRQMLRKQQKLKNERQQGRQIIQAQSIIRDDLDLIPQLPKMTEQINQDNLNIFFQQPVQFHLIQDEINYASIQQIIKIQKQYNKLFCIVACSDEIQYKRVAFDAIQRKRPHLLREFFDGRYPFK